eukprot:3566364-Rhodomonas_salina.1
MMFFAVLRLRLVQSGGACAGRKVGPVVWCSSAMRAVLRERESTGLEINSLRSRRGMSGTETVAVLHQRLPSLRILQGVRRSAA